MDPFARIVLMLSPRKRFFRMSLINVLGSITAFVAMFVISPLFFLVVVGVILSTGMIGARIKCPRCAKPIAWREYTVLGRVKVNQSIEDQGDVNEGREHHVELLEA